MKNNLMCVWVHERKLSMKKAIITFLVLVLGSSVSGIAFGEGEKGDVSPSAGSGFHQSQGIEEARKKVVARVNGVDITMDAVVSTMRRMEGRQAHGAGGAEKMADLKNKALQRLIFQELAYEKAKAEGMHVDEKAIDDSMATLRTRAGGDEKFKEFLKSSSMTEDELRALVERNLLIQAIFAREVTGKVTISEDDVKKEYEKEKGQFTKPEKVAITDVVFFLKLEDDDSVKRVREVLKRINEDKDKNPMNLETDGTFVVRDLDVGKDKETELYEAARKLKVGELSDLVKTSDSLHIIKLREYSPEEQIPFENVKGFIEKKLMAEAQQKRMQEWEAELRKGAKIEILEPQENGK
jgi:hypothetical protein